MIDRTEPEIIERSLVESHLTECTDSALRSTFIATNYVHSVNDFVLSTCYIGNMMIVYRMNMYIPVYFCMAS